MSNAIDQTAEANSQQIEQQDSKPEVSQGTSRVVANRVPLDVKEVTQELLKYGHIEEADSAVLFRKAVTHEHMIDEALAPLDLTLRLDTHRGIAFLVVAKDVSQSPESEQAWSHPLVRRQRLTLEQSLLIAILRQVFMLHEQESGIGQSAAKISLDELLSQFLTYFEDSGSDTRNETRLTSLLDQLKIHGIVSELDSNLEVTIRPIIAHLANAESLSALLRALAERAGRRELSEPEQG